MRPRRVAVIPALGIVQILAWGSSFYLLAVLAAPIVADTGWPLPWVVGALSGGLLVAGLVSPRVGVTIGVHGGRPILAAAALLLAAGLLAIGLAPSLPFFMAGWLVIGLGMGCGLYDAAFATLGRLYGEAARPAITTLTLWGGFASTVCWPLSAYLVEHLGWRGACIAYAGLHLLVTLPLVLGVIPRVPAVPPATDAKHSTGDGLSATERRIFLVLAGVQVVGSAILALVSVHLITLLQARGVALASAVFYGTLIGPSQVGARLIEMAGRGRYHPLWTLTGAVLLLALGLLLLALDLPGLGLALVLYGGGNGIFSIARGTVPLALFGAGRYAPLVGRLARPSLIALALAPLLGTVALSHGGPEALWQVLAGLALVNLVLVAALWRLRGEGQRGP